jgi:hypothetical protein
MKKYKLIVMHPGMTRFDTTVEAEGYKIINGSIIFYNVIRDGAITFENTVAVYPVELTIIHHITEEE